jgi:nucleoside permease NupC
MKKIKKINITKKILLSFSEQLKSVANYGGSAFIFIFGSVNIDERLTACAIAVGWWLFMQVIAHAILALANTLSDDK